MYGISGYNAYLWLPETKKEIGQAVEYEDKGKRLYLYYQNDLNCYVLFFPKDKTKKFEVEKIPLSKEEFHELTNSEW